MRLSKEDVNPPTQKTHWDKSFKTTMIFRPGEVMLFVISSRQHEVYLVDVLVAM